jgi:hypothetical protein
VDPGLPFMNSKYDCERQLVSLEPQGQVHYDWDLATQSGAVHIILQVVEPQDSDSEL